MDYHPTPPPSSDARPLTWEGERVAAPRGSRLCRRAAITAGLLAALAAGCSKGGSGSLADVSGTVTMDGKPLAGVNVIFYPVGDPSQPLNRKPSSKGATDGTGHYTLSCEDGRPGAVVGKHKVVVEWPTQYERGAPPKTPAIPARFSVMSESPLEKEVTASSNTIPIELTSR
jgi:hypothetical protein